MVSSPYSLAHGMLRFCSPRWHAQPMPLACCTPARQLGQRKVSLVVASSSARSAGRPNRLHAVP